MHSHTKTKRTWPIRLHRRPAFLWTPSTKHRFHRSRTLPLPPHDRGFILIFCPFPHRITTLIARTTHHHGATQKRSHNYSRFVDTDHQPSHTRNHLKTNFTNRSTFLCHRNISATYQCFFDHVLLATCRHEWPWWGCLLSNHQLYVVSAFFHYLYCRHSLVNTNLFQKACGIIWGSSRTNRPFATQNASCGNETAVPWLWLEQLVVMLQNLITA